MMIELPHLAEPYRTRWVNTDHIVTMFPYYDGHTTVTDRRYSIELLMSNGFNLVAYFQTERCMNAALGRIRDAIDGK